MKKTLDLPNLLRMAARRRCKLPLVECAHEAQPGEEMTPERVGEVLLEEEAAAHRERQVVNSNSLSRGSVTD